MSNLAVAGDIERGVVRPLKTLIPLIQAELQRGDNAGREHYTEAGDMLREARTQVTTGRWGSWVSKNFDLSLRTAQLYMQWSRHQEEARNAPSPQRKFNSINEMTGHRERQREERRSSQTKAFNRAMRDIDRDEFVRERSSRDEEIRLHRELAAELIDLGYRALAMRLHPDKGGTREAMTRLTAVRDELKSIAAQRRFI